MPLYEYRCDSCGKVFEVIQKFSDEPLQMHPDCGGAVERLISASALQFKGSGWYITDYAKGNGKKDGAADKAEKKDSGESKPKTDSSSPSTGTTSTPAASTTTSASSDKK